MTKRRRPCTDVKTAAPARARWRAITALLILSVLLLITACQRTPPPALTHGVYVWQRAWDARLVAAVNEARSFAGSLHVLALQFDDGRYVEAQADWKVVYATGLPITVVARINGSKSPRTDWFIDVLGAHGRTWAAYSGGHFDLELDYDCGTDLLAAYAQLLRKIRASVPAIRTLSITALPAWRDAAALDDVLAAVDFSVLQVHSVSRPDEGLFDGVRARGWVAEWARRSGTRPFLVALPAYGARFKLDLDGTVAAVESEQRLPARSAAAREVRVDPREIAIWLDDLRARRYPNLAGIVWFRLPRDGDERTWALRTLRAVVDGQPLQSALRVATPIRDNGAIDVSLHSDGSIDAPPPGAVVVDGHCTAGDGVNGYRLVRSPRWRFESDTVEPLRAGSGRLVGWLRCADPAQVRVSLE
jgi:hypothetical protein